MIFAASLRGIRLALRVAGDVRGMRSARCTAGRSECTGVRRTREMVGKIDGKSSRANWNALGVCA